MRKTILTIALTAAACGAWAADTLTNTPAYNEATATKPSSLSPVDAPKDFGKWELTLGGAGVVVPRTGGSEFSVALSLATDPLMAAPNVWFGLNQEIGWDPSFAGSSDLYAEYAWDVWRDLWVNTGWSAGAIYGAGGGQGLFRTGPQVELEYYIGNTTFLYASANWDVYSRRSAENPNAFRYSFGIGWTF